MKRRILIFSLAYYPHVGGAEVSVKEITDRMPDMVFDMVTLRFRSDDAKEERVGNINVHRVGGPKLLFPLTAFLKAFRLHREKRYDIVWSIMAAYAGFAALFFKLVHARVPFVLTLQEGDSFSHIRRRVRLVYPIFLLIFKKADCITAISNYLAQWARGMGVRCPVEVIPNGVDYGFFSQPLNVSTRPSTRSELGFSDNDTVLITASRLVPKNGIDDSILALSLLGSSYKFIILGVGKEEERLRDLAKEVGVYDRVVFVGFVEHQKLVEYLKSSDIFIRPSRSEGFGNSFIEAMAAGVPVIATPVGGIVDFLKDGETGLFCNVDDPKSIAFQVGRLTEDPGLRSAMVANANELVRTRYDWSLVAETMRDRVFLRF